MDPGMVLIVKKSLAMRSQHGYPIETPPCRKIISRRCPESPSSPSFDFAGFKHSPQMYGVPPCTTTLMPVSCVSRDTMHPDCRPASPDDVLRGFTADRPGGYMRVGEPGTGRVKAGTCG